MNEDLSRRNFLALTGAGLAAAPAAKAFQSPKKVYAYASSWTNGPFGAGGGGGVSWFTVNLSDGSLTAAGRTGPEFDGLNGGCVHASPNGHFLYCTNEIKHLNGGNGTGGGVLTFAIDQQTGSLTHLNTQPSMGVNATWVTTSPNGTRVVVANHGDADPVIRVVKKNGVPEIENFFDDGTVALFVVKPDGTLEPACDVAVFDRTYAGAQGSPHAHSANFDPSGRFVLACDAGAGDLIYVYRVEPGSRALANAKAYKTRPGISPRHNAFHPRLPYVFVIHERESSLASYHFDSKTGEIKLIDTVPTVPAGFTARNAPADIRVHPNGKFVYGSNRGHDSIAILRIEEATGKLAPVDIVPAGGTNCREFNFDPSGKYLFVANMGSNNIVTFAVDPDTGKMTPTGAKIQTPKPASLQLLAL
ncbi:MAG TPA: lactonase family protein [Bryobacteraceae bacterium]|nr:lactonase family protein [Bryobacteraceae bacterium]